MGNRVSSTTIIHPNVEIGHIVTIEEYCILGASFREYDGEKP